MTKSPASSPHARGRFSKVLTSVTTWLNRPENTILLVLGIILSFAVLYPLWSVVQNSLTIHAGKEQMIASSLGYPLGGLQVANWAYLLSGPYGQKYLWEPLGNSLLLATLSCVFALIFGGVAAFLVTRTNMPCKKWISTVFIFPYIMPQWTLALVWKNLFWSAKVTGGADGLLAFISNGAIAMPEWWCRGLFPCAMVLGMHYAAFAYILIGGIFKNMDASLEEAATILNTPKWKIIFRITIPMIIPASAFYPEPKIDSAVVRIELYDEPLIPADQLDAFFELAKAGFGQKRKTLRNALSANLHRSPAEAESLLRSAGIDPQRRAETLTISEWSALLRVC